MTPLMVVSLVILIVVYFLECLFAFLEKETLRKILKVFAMPALLLFIYSLGVVNAYIIVALSLGWLGDIFMIFKKKKQMLGLGIATFLAGHIFYLLLIINLLSYPVQVWHYVALGVFGLMTPAFTYKALYPHIGKFVIGGTYYFYMLAVLLLFSTLLMFDNFNVYKLLIFIGTLFFITSDTSILISNFFIDYKKREFIIMSTYLIAQTLLALGISYLII